MNPQEEEFNQMVYIGPAGDVSKVGSPPSCTEIEAQNAAFLASVPWQILAADFAIEASEKALEGHGNSGAAVRLVGGEIDFASPRAQAAAWHQWLCEAGQLTPIEAAVDWAAIVSSRGLA